MGDDVVHDKFVGGFSWLVHCFCSRRLSIRFGFLLLGMLLILCVFAIVFYRFDFSRLLDRVGSGSVLIRCLIFWTPLALNPIRCRGWSLALSFRVVLLLLVVLGRERRDFAIRFRVCDRSIRSQQFSIHCRRF